MGCIAHAALQASVGQFPKITGDVSTIFYVTPTDITGYEFRCLPSEFNVVDDAIYVRCVGRSQRKDIITIATLRVSASGETMSYIDDFLREILHRCEPSPAM